jgi:ribonucleoside-diphosphate reductase alpha chain
MFQDARQLLSDAKFYEGYSRYNDILQRYETWEEAVDRVMEMHKEYYKEKLSPDLEEAISFATNIYKDKGILGAQRALQFGGDQILKHQMKMYNCFKSNTRFLTRNGMKSFDDFSNNDKIEVLTHKNNWKNAVVKSYEKQELYEITFSRKSSKKKIIATKNHRWILKDGSETTKLKPGDQLFTLSDNKFEKFSWNNATIKQKLYWCYGYVYGDGTVTKENNQEYSLVRLCGKDNRFLYRFIEMGFSSSTNFSLKGDNLVYTGKYNKTLPDVSENIDDLIAFIRGFLDADGEKSSSYWAETGSSFASIYQTLNGPRGEKTREFIKNIFPLVGVWILNEKYCDYETNFGKHNGYRYSLVTTYGEKYSAYWKVESIEKLNISETVWCLEVEDDHSFILDGGIVTGNCTSSYADRPEFFGEIFYIMLCGCGAGFSVQKHHVAKLPNIVQRTKAPKIHTVEDSIEGWADALDALMSSYFEESAKYPEYRGHRIYFDLTKIRPKGSKISGGFKAPGPDALRLALDRIEHILQGATLSKKKANLKPIQVYDIIMHAADAVISGGVRRSATICLFSHDDEDMISAKTGAWYIDHPQRGRSNNSAVILRNSITKDQFEIIFDKIKQFGEPGFVFVDDLELCFNPCVEIGMYPQIDGQTGFQGCNLSEINGTQCVTADKFYELCKAASIIGTLQAGYTNFKFVSDITKKIFEREALIGVSVTGWMSNPEVLFDKKILKKGAAIVLETNKKIAKLIGINPAARTTCVKPSGNASVLLKTPSGIHPEHSPIYLRNIQINKDNEVADIMLQTNPYMIEESGWSSNKNDYVISFPIVSKEGSYFKDDIKGVKHLELVKLAQEYWVEAGKDEELCINKAASHNVSNTIVVDNWDEVKEYVFKNRKFFAGISFISDSGDKDYYQAPNQKVESADTIVKKYGSGSIFASGLIVDGNKIFDNLWLACSTAQGIGEKLDIVDADNALKIDWVRRFENFAKNYFNGDMKQAEYCLKDVHLLHKWYKIQQTLKDINWLEELTEKKFVDIDTTGAAACAGVNERGEALCFI